MPDRFFKLTLRTTDVDAACAFYRAVLGGDVALDAVPLHEQALARGARPHWLGWLPVPDLDAARATLTAHGAMALGPQWLRDGLEALTLRDPGGAVIALARQSAITQGEPEPAVVSYVLNTSDLAAAKRDYGALFGWSFGAALSLEGVGTLHPFAWEEGGAVVGAMRDITGHPEVHPHWLFHFHVEALPRALEAVRAEGGEVVAPMTLDDGAQLAVCHDPQGAAFALRTRPTR